MKKVVISVLCIAMIVLMSSCSKVVNQESKKQIVIPEYLSDCDAQFNETDNQLLISFGLKDKNKKYVSSNGVAKVLVKDKTKNKLYNKSIDFTKNDFSDYTSKMWKGTRYLCGIYINADEIAPAANDEGIVELTVSAADEQAVFETQKINVFGLPTKNIEIKKPKLPKTVSYYDFDNKETKISITDVSFKTEIIGDYSTVDAKVTVKMIKNNLESNSDSFMIKCILKDSNGVKVSSEDEYGDYIKNGESEYIDVSFSDLDPNESYKLTFESVDDSI